MKIQDEQLDRQKFSHFKFSPPPIHNIKSTQISVFPNLKLFIELVWNLQYTRFVFLKDLNNNIQIYSKSLIAQIILTIILCSWFPRVRLNCWNCFHISSSHLKQFEGANIGKEPFSIPTHVLTFLVQNNNLSQTLCFTTLCIKDKKVLLQSHTIFLTFLFSFCWL